MIARLLFIGWCFHSHLEPGRFSGGISYKNQAILINVKEIFIEKLYFL